MQDIGATQFCPEWCEVSHERRRDELAVVHVCERTGTAGEVLARVRLTVTAEGAAGGGPSVMVRPGELTIEQARVLGETLLDIATEATVRTAC